MEAIAPLVRSFNDTADGSAWKSRELILHLLEHSQSPFARSQFTPGHITCTGIVLHPSSCAALFVHHARLDRWLLPGGHVEAEDETPMNAARREVLEETSADLDPVFVPFLAGLDVHGIPPKRGEPYHLHHDLIIAFRARSLAFSCSPESHAVEWLEPSQFAERGIAESIRLAFDRARSLTR